MDHRGWKAALDEFSPDGSLDCCGIGVFWVCLVWPWLNTDHEAYSIAACNPLIGLFACVLLNIISYKCIVLMLFFFPICLVAFLSHSYLTLFMVCIRKFTG